MTSIDLLKEIENKIGQLQYEISCLGLDEEDLTGVSIRTEELKNLVKKLSIPVVVEKSEQYFCCKEQIEQRCSEQCLGCFQFQNKD